MRLKTILIAVTLVTVFWAGRVTAGSGTLDSPDPPGSTLSYTLEDIYNRLDTGAAGAQSTFMEPTTGPTTGTGHTLDEIMAKAPLADDTNGATTADVLTDRTFWGLNTASGQWGLQTGTAIPAPVPRTGQTATFESGDDGYLEKGVAWPNPRFTDNGDGTVVDTLTGLIWLKDANCFDLRNWTDALADANTLADGSCGLTDGSNIGDWRLPNLRELFSLIDFSQSSSPALPNGHPFTGVQLNVYWSSSTYAVNTGFAWRVDMIDGDLDRDDKLINTFSYVWPVRGGQ